MPRVRRQRCSSGLYHVVQRAAVDTLFEDRRDKDAFLNILEQSKAKNGFYLFGFCLAMDREYHLILGTHTSDLSKIMKEINIRYALYKQTKNVFRDRFISTPLSETEDVQVLRMELSQRRMRSIDPHYADICTTYHHLIDAIEDYVPCRKSMAPEDVQQDLAQELARLGMTLSSFHQHVELRNAWIRRIRRTSSLSLKQIGTVVGLSESSISKILNV